MPSDKYLEPRPNPGARLNSVINANLRAVSATPYHPLRLLSCPPVLYGAEGGLERGARRVSILETRESASVFSLKYTNRSLANSVPSPPFTLVSRVLKIKWYFFFFLRNERERTIATGFTKNRRVHAHADLRNLRKSRGNHSVVCAFRLPAKRGKGKKKEERKRHVSAASRRSS